MSTIEHVWDALDRCVRQRVPVPGNIQQLCTAIEEEWDNIPQATINRLINSMQRRCVVLHEDSVYELRLLSRRGVLLSEPSPSVNVSNMDLPPAIYKSPPSTGSLASSPDSVLKQKLLHSHYPGSTSRSCSSSQLDHSSFDRPSRSEYHDQCQQLLSCPPPPPHYAPHLPRTGSSPTSPLEFIFRGPDGLFMMQPYDQTSVHISHNIRSLRKDFPQSTEVQRSVSPCVRREPPLVLSVDLPPCGGSNPNPTTMVRAMAKHLSLHGRFYLDGKKDSCAGHPGESSLYSDSNSDMYPQPSLEESKPGYLSLKRAVQPAISSTLMLQMEHERETGNLSRCLKLAREREELERKLRKYTLERNATLDGKSKRPGIDEESWRETEECDPIWKPQESTSLQNHPHRCHPQANWGSSSMAKRPSSPSYIHWEASPLTSATSLVAALHTTSERTVTLHCDPPVTQCPSLSPVTQHHLRAKRLEGHSKRRVSHQPLERQEGKEAASFKTHTGLCDTTHMSTELKGDDSESHEWNSKSNQCHSNGRISHRSKPDVSVNKVHGVRKVALTKSQPFEKPSQHTVLDLSDCLEMSVDEPEGSVDPPTNPIKLQSLLAEKGHRGPQTTKKGHRGHPSKKSPVPREEREKWHRRSPRGRSPTTIQPPRPVLRKALSLGGSQNGDGRHHQRSHSLDSRRQSQGNFLTPDAWVDSLSHENCSSPFSFRPDSVFWEPEFTSAPETNHTEAPTACPPPPQDLQPPSKAPQQLYEAYKGNAHIPNVRKLVLERQQPLPPTPPPVPSVPIHPPHNPRKKASIFPDASRWPITYQEALRSVQRTEARKNASLPREHPRPSDCRGRTTAPSLLRGYSWPAPLHTSQPSQEEEKQEEVVEEEEGEERRGMRGMKWSWRLGGINRECQTQGGATVAMPARAVAGGVWSLPMGACPSACPQPSPALLRPSRRYRGTQRRHVYRTWRH
ncbi:uncharacterized protein ACWYII_015134 isoform 2-T3 [Salvelinus alpinus]